jgi:hypothetical protein
MKNLLGLGVFGTFGKPYGFQQYFYFDTDFNQTLDLNTNAIEIFPSTELFSVKREIHNGLNSICISKYSHANEINSNRGGTFIGSCILLNEAYTNSENIYLLLTELHNDLISSEKNLINSVLQVQQATQLEVKEPIQFDNVKSQLIYLKETDYYSTRVDQSKKFLIVPKSNEDKPTQIKTFIETAIKYFNDVDTLYFTFDEKVVRYVNQKGLLKSINWTSFLDQKEAVIKERAEVKRSQEGRLGKFESNSQNRKSNSSHGSFTHWDYKKQRWDENEVKKRVDEYNRLFEYCSELQNQKTNTPRQESSQQPHFERQSYAEPRGIFKVNKFLFSFILNILFILFISIYFGFFNEQTETKELNPTPNSELSINDRKKVEKIGIKGRSGKDIIQTIFQQNPTDIKAHYSDQIKQYMEYLRSKNPDCFTKESDQCKCDSLVFIPSFKKDKK